METTGPFLGVAALGVVATAVVLGLTLGAAPGDVAAVDPGPVAAAAVAEPGVAGRWSGTLRERGGPTVDVVLTTAGAGGTAALDIPALECRYTGTVADTAPSAAVVTRLRTTANPQRLCAATATVRLTPLSARSLRYELLTTCDAHGACTRRDASAVLTGP